MLRDAEEQLFAPLQRLGDNDTSIGGLSACRSPAASPRQ
jgi:hypothetical protein